MEFKVPYLTTMREQAPGMFNQLQRAGKLEAHVQAKPEEASRMFDDLTRNAPKLPNGLPENPDRREAERTVLETLIEFPSDTQGRSTSSGPARSTNLFGGKYKLSVA
jgi:hypothetical protein